MKRRNENQPVTFVETLAVFISNHENVCFHNTNHDDIIDATNHPFSITDCSWHKSGQAPSASRCWCRRDLLISLTRSGTPRIGMNHKYVGTYDTFRAHFFRFLGWCYDTCRHRRIFAYVCKISSSWTSWWSYAVDDYSNWCQQAEQSYLIKQLHAISQSGGDPDSIRWFINRILEIKSKNLRRNE